MMVRPSSQIVIFLLWFLCGAKFGFSLSGSYLQNRCNIRDREVLLEFKKSVVDPSRLLSTWSNEEDCCEWIGVECNDITGRVTKLDLHYELISLINLLDESEKLTGEVNLRVLQLDFLNYLDLSSNNFTAIRDSSNDGLRYHNLSLFTSQHHNPKISTLSYLDLSHNFDLKIDNLTWLSHIPSLTYLNLSFIDLHREGKCLHSMSSLLPSILELKLVGCQLDCRNLPSAYINLTSLTVLDLSGNYFNSKVLEWVSNSTSLSYLNLDENHVDDMPITLLNLQNLKYLSLYRNKLKGTIPKWLAQYKNLQELDLSNNSFHGSIPPILGNLSSLTHLDVNNNHLNGNLPKSLHKLSSLVSLRLGGNYFSGVVSESNFANLTNLRTLDLSSSAFLFNVSSDWIPPFQLEKMLLKSCLLGPQFPTWIYTQRFLETLDISSSGISVVDHDKLWSLLCNITTYLDMSNNSISWDISNRVLNTELIYLTSNKFNGGLPCITPNVVGFFAGNNSFSGPISPLLCGTLKAQQHLLSFLDLSYNHLSGELPDFWMNLVFINTIILGSNNVTGRIPQSIGSLSSLEALDLYDNNMLGEIPLSLRQCNQLKFLNLGRNQFSGRIPSWITQSMVAIGLRSNEFSGNIPPQICQLSSLIILDLAGNSLSGSIPKCFCNLSAMTNGSAFDITAFLIADIDYGFLSSFRFHTKGQEFELKFKDSNFWRLVDLSKNNLVGSIPPELFHLVGLISLNLSHNHLTGKIPPVISQMKNLESLDFSMNKLSGEIPLAMINLSFLEYLNLSFNNFTGKIPIATQLQSFDASCYMGNRELCGAPLNNCMKEKKSVDIVNAKDEDEFWSWFYIGGGVGFAAGFWGVCIALLFKRAWRHAYFRFLNDIKDHFYIKMLLVMNSTR